MTDKPTDKLDRIDGILIDEESVYNKAKLYLKYQLGALRFP